MGGMGVLIGGGPVGDRHESRPTGEGTAAAIQADDVDLAAMPLPLSTTWAVLGSLGADLTVADGALVVSRDLPGHRWCHAISVLDPARVDEAQHWLERAAREFPDVSRPAIGLPVEPDRELWRRQPCPQLPGMTVEWWPQHWVALEARQVRPVAPLPKDCTVVPFTGDDLWEQFEALPSDGGAQYRRTWVGLKRRRQEAGDAMYFAGVRDGRVVATGGIVLCDLGDHRVARFEDTQTLPGHRRRGLAGHVIAAAHSWAAGRGAASSVLVADAGGEAISLYEQLGFAVTDEAWMVLPRRTR